MIYPAYVVANTFIDLFKQVGENPSKIQLIKIMYLAHATSLIVDEKGLIDEPFMAWGYGPVPRDFYFQYLYETKKTADNMEVSGFFEDGNKLFFGEKKLIDNVYFHFRDISPMKLAMLTHGDAWENTPQSEEIQDKDIKNEFRKKIIIDQYGNIDFTECKVLHINYVHAY